MDQPRQPAGSPEGGQYAGTVGSEAAAVLDAPQDAGQHWIHIERQHGPSLAVGPYPSAAAAATALDSVLVDGLCEEDALDCYSSPGSPGEGEEQVIIDLNDPHHTGVEPEPFVFDQDYDNHEQVRPYFAAYLRRLQALEIAGKYPYNDSFKGHIPGIEGPDEDTAIYLLQGMGDRDAMRAKRDDFLAAGGREMRPSDLHEGQQLRGTVVHCGFYVGDTGWTQFESARLVKNRGRLMVLEKGKRSSGHLLLGGSVLLLPDSGAPTSRSAR